MNNGMLQIRTPEGITFSYRLAGPVVRFLAYLVDLFSILVLVNIVKYLSLIAGFLSRDVGGALLMFGYFAISIGYGLLTEWLCRGQTVGKRVLHLRVMDGQGLRLQFHQILIRNLLRSVDMLPALYMVGGLSCLFSRKAQRLGDIAANTVVVHAARLSEPDLDQLLAGKFNSLRQHPHLEARLRQRVSPEEARLALQALLRREELEPIARVELFADLASHFKEIVTFPPEAVDAMPDEQYIRNIVDILFRTRNVESKTPARPIEPAGV